jgi:hypothetical protein
MTSVNSFHTRNSINTLRLQYWPAFEVTVHALPQEKVQELHNVLNKFVSGLQTYSKLESRELRCRSTRSLSCPLMGPKTVPFASSTTDSAASQQSSGLPQMQQSTFQEDDHVRFAPSLPEKLHRYSQKDSWRKSLGQEERPDTPQNIQITPCDAPIQLLNQQLVHVSLDDSDEDAEVLEDNNISSSIDFLATLRQTDPQRALDLERQYDANIAELENDNKREAVLNNTATNPPSM